MEGAGIDRPRGQLIWAGGQDGRSVGPLGVRRHLSASMLGPRLARWSWTAGCFEIGGRPDGCR